MSVFDNYLPWTKKRIAQFDAAEVELFFKPAKNVAQDQSIEITNLMTILYSKLNQPLNLEKFLARKKLVEWYTDIGKEIFSVDRLKQLVVDSQCDKLPEHEKPAGINLVGYSRSATGLGEDLRNLALLLESLSIPYCVVRIGHPADSRFIEPLSNASDTPLFSTSIFCMNVIEFQKMTQIYVDFKRYFGYVILQAPWELPAINESWKECLQQVDRIWAISQFVESVFVNADYKNVTWVPPVFNLTSSFASTEISNSQVRPFIFLYVFDAGSFISRKNPIGLVESFQKAFAKNEKVSLILKISNVSTSLDWDNLTKKCQSDTRVKVINESYSPHQLSKLINCCDCYVSLHRSEGFGRTIAEACFNKKPVITTGWSGNLDIFPADYRYLVKYTLRPLEINEYPGGKDQYWAEPDLADAAQKMYHLWCLNDQQKAKVANDNFKFVMGKYSLDAVKSIYENLLAERLHSNFLESRVLN